jgi:DNA-binding transcriptional MerR regulator
MDKSADAFRTISEAAAELDLPQHVLRFWETRFPEIKPMKRAGGRRYYRPHDLELLHAIKSLLYAEGFTIKGVQRLLKEQGAAAIASAGRAMRDDQNRSEIPAVSKPPEDCEPLPEESVPPQREASVTPCQDQTFGLSAETVAELETILAVLADCVRILEGARHSGDTMMADISDPDSHAAK